MRALIVTALVLALVTAGCGPKRGVVPAPDDVAGRKGDTWHVTSEPRSTPSETADALHPAR